MFGKGCGWIGGSMGMGTDWIDPIHEIFEDVSVKSAPDS